MNVRTTLILVILLALLGAYVYFFEIKGEIGKEATPTPSTVQVWDLEEGQVVGLTVTGPEGTTRLRREVGSEWQMEAPSQEPADDLRVGALSDSLAHLSATRALTDVTDLEPFGLATSSWTVEVALANGEIYRLQIGEQNPSGGSYYVKKEGDPTIYLVYASTVQGLQRLVTNPPYRPTPTATLPPPETPTATPTPAETAAPTPSPGG
ncbi:MAG: DUF4340 domain-containing protein [Anaerolineae bacterium]